MRPNYLEIERRIQRQQSRFVQLNTRFQKRSFRTRQYHAYVDELFALHFWYDANYRVVIPELIAHESPPRESSEASHDASISTRHMPLYFRQWSETESFQTSNHPAQVQQSLGSCFQSSSPPLDHPLPGAHSQTEAGCAA